MEDLLSFVLFILFLGTACVIWYAIWYWFGGGRDERRQEKARRARAAAESEAREVRRCRPCASMDRATLIAHVAEFSALDLSLSRRAAPPHKEAALRRRLFGGLHTAHLLELCKTIAADGDRKQTLNPAHSCSSPKVG